MAVQRIPLRVLRRISGREIHETTGHINTKKFRVRITIHHQRPMTATRTADEQRVGASRPLGNFEFLKRGTGRPGRFPTPFHRGHHGDQSPIPDKPDRMRKAVTVPMEADA